MLGFSTPQAGLSATARQAARKIFRNNGFDIVRYDHKHHPEARRIKLIQDFGITVVLDVGAHTGEYASQLRNLGYSGRIVSMEPLQAAYQQLARSAAADPLWETRNFALGESDGFEIINISANEVSSSLMNVTQTHLDSEPSTGVIGSQQIQIQKLDLLLIN